MWKASLKVSTLRCPERTTACEPRGGLLRLAGILRSWLHNAAHFRKPSKQADRLVVPTITLLEGRFKAQVRRLTRRSWCVSLEERVDRLSRYLIGWRGYYGFCETSSVLRDLDGWIRRRLRSVVWKQWKVYRKRKREVIHLGVDERLAHATAWSAKGPWRSSHTRGICLALKKDYFASLGLPELVPCRNI